MGMYETLSNVGGATSPSPPPDSSLYLTVIHRVHPASLNTAVVITLQKQSGKPCGPGRLDIPYVYGNGVQRVGTELNSDHRIEIHRIARYILLDSWNPTFFDLMVKVMDGRPTCPTRWICSRCICLALSSCSLKFEKRKECHPPVQLIVIWGPS